MKKKVPFVEPSEHSECGLACVTMILNYYKDPATLNQLRDIYGVPKGGNTLLNLKEILEERGIETKAIRVLEFDILMEQTEPVICFWENRHYVVLEKLTEDSAVILDPALGKRKIPFEEFAGLFTDFALLIEGENINVSQTEKKKNAALSIFKQIFKEQKLKASIFIGLTLLIQGVSILVPRLTQLIIDRSQAPGQLITQIGWGIVLLFVAYYLLQVARGLTLIILEQLFDLTLMKAFMKKIMHLPLRFFVNRSTGDLIFRANLSVIIQQIMSQRMLTLFVDFLFVFIYLILMLSISPQMTMVALIGALIMGGISFVNSKKVQAITDKELLAQSRVQRILVELFEGMETVKSSGSEKQFYKKWLTNFKQQIDLRVEKDRFSTWVRTIQTSIQFILPVLLIYIGVFQLMNNELTLGQIISFNSLAGAFITPIVVVFDSYTEILLLRSYFGKLNEILDATETRKKKKGAAVIEDIKSLDIQSVSFKYSRFEENILDDISFSVRAGEKIAIVGKSGSGKSTLLKLLAGLYEPTEGSIEVNHKDLRNVHEESVKRVTSIVNQKPTIFNASLLENIVMNQEKFDERRLERAIYDSRVSEIIQNLPLGLETPISEGGMNLSGGQMQRISIARALVKETQLLLMDEPTSSLDNISENFIMNQLKHYDFTCIVIAHRLNTVKHFDRILVIDQGRIVEEGTHESLIQKRGHYYSIYHEPTESSVERPFFSTEY
ncbi:peptidase domain-containing ABC transporter [uncultured Enterococcus sp.]|uniref:peptidase domain-containing ABC transporter n=1 Tax=uncultured Enterococcus sp. TaxID=167972 RepID=UPI002AA6971E|nr:peptidase domain-containing ABC transporter [uncultured Enterococcus sp.]